MLWIYFQYLGNRSKVYPCAHSQFFQELKICLSFANYKNIGKDEKVFGSSGQLSVLRPVPVGLVLAGIPHLRREDATASARPICPELLLPAPVTALLSRHFNFCVSIGRGRKSWAILLVVGRKGTKLPFIFARLCVRGMLEE